MDAEPGEPLLGRVEAGKRVGELAGAEGRQSPVHDGVRVLKLLAACGEQLLGAALVGRYPLHRAKRQQAKRAYAERARLPDLVAGRPQHRDGAVQVVKGRVVVADVLQAGRPGASAPGRAAARRT